MVMSTVGRGQIWMAPLPKVASYKAYMFVMLEMLCLEM